MTWIYLSKHGKDEYINLLAQGARTAPTKLENWSYDQDSSSGLFIRGIMKHKLIKRCWEDRRPFWFVDTGYFGNRPGAKNPHGWKYWHRIVPDDLQHGRVLPRPADRWSAMGIDIQPWRRSGRSILIAAPDEKPGIFYDTDPEAWLAQTLETLRQHTDRPIVVRQRNPNIRQRTRDPSTSFATALEQDIWAVVTFNSNAATEAILAGIPAFVSAPNAARPVAGTDLAQIESPNYADSDLVHQWACHLAYGQFHVDEMRDGRAQRLLDQTREMLS